MQFSRPCLAIVGWVLVASSATSASAADDLFRNQVAPIFEHHCVRCHQGPKPKGGLDLTTGKSALAGGESGAVIEPGKPADSLLIEYIGGDPPEMPKNSPPLSPAQVKAIRGWIKAGAVWPDGPALVERREYDAKWWSLQPLSRPSVPQVNSAWVRTPVDAFVLTKLSQHELSPSPEADRRTLIRRLTYDLHGLPPTPDEIESFLQDPAVDAYERLADRLVASPRYGERWARHWLDVVHFGETHGYDKDQPRNNAWPYRDYVIRAFNADKPYSKFVEEQLAGDVLYPGTRDGLEALGFISAGPWDLIGHAEVPEEKIDGKVARHLDRDDMVANTLQTFISLTVQCAQCHDHKFDPISQEDYYSLQAVFAAIDRTDKTYDLDPAVAKTRSELQSQQQALAARKAALEAKIAAAAGPRLAELDQQIARSSSAALVEFGYHSAIETAQDVVKWVQVDLRRPVALSRLVLRPCRDDFAGIGDGFGFPVRYKVELSDDPQFARGVQAIADRTAADVANPGLERQTIEVGGRAARFIRVTATRLAPRLNDFILALAELEAIDSQGKNVAQGVSVAALDSIEAAPRWRKANLVDGLYLPNIPAGGADALRKERAALLASASTPDERQEQARIEGEQSSLAARLASLPPPQTAYIGAVHTGSGTFRGTGGQGGKPRPVYVLHRGNVQQPADREVVPGAIAAIKPLAGRFDLPPGHSEGHRRAALARWLTSRDHPLTWRTIANRLWHYHLGRGLAATPNDFGRNGTPPTHPELLDWLAVELRDGGQLREGGQSLKALHRLIVTSAVYRQSSAVRADYLAVDADNRLLWRANRRKLEAEAVRDSVLALAGRLDPTMYGPSFRDFVIDKPEHSPHYEYHLHDPTDPKSHRRTIYRFLVRSQPQPFMTTLDCADPSMQVDRRSESLSALQALALMNNALMVAMAGQYAARLARAGGDLAAQVERAHYEVLGRPATPPQSESLLTYARQHGLANLCRVLMNANEFVFVD